MKSWPFEIGIYNRILERPKNLLFKNNFLGLGRTNNRMYKQPLLILRN